MDNSKTSSTKENKLYEEIVNTWGSKYKGIGIVKSNDKLKFENVISIIITKMIAKKPDINILILPATWDERKRVVASFENNNIDYKNKVTLLTIDYYNDKFHNKNNDLVVIIDFSKYTEAIDKAFEKGKFKLGFIIKNIGTNDYKDINDNIPIIDFTSVNADLANLRLQHPVREEWIGVDFNPQEAEKYDKYTDFITSTVNIFGTFENMDIARKGSDTESSEQILHKIANYNGWSEDIDTSIPFNKDIDKYFNPITLKERASNCYNIIRERQLLLTDCNSKLNAITNLVRENRDKHILIVSKRGEFASKITESINFEFGNICGDYHDCIEPRHLVDSKGQFVRVKAKDSPMYGQPKIVKSQFISSANMRLFSKGLLNVLSIKNSSSDELKISVGVIIFTTPMCDLVDEFRYKFNNLTFDETPLKVYKVYMRNTIEEKRLLKEKQSSSHIIISNVNFSKSDENFPEIVC